MNFVVSFLLCLSLVLSSLNPFIPTTYALTQKLVENKNDSDDLTKNLVQITTNIPTYDKVSVSDNNTGGSHLNATNFVTLDLSGYCTIDMPQSHFTLSTSSNDTVKMMTYKDNKTRLTMSYVTNMGSDADIPGFITREQAGVDTTTNNRVEEAYGDKTWMKVIAEGREDGCNVYVWYTLNQDKSAAFWVKAKVAPDSDCEEFYNIISEVFETFSCYYISGAMFETPDTGYYENYVDTDKTKGDTSNYVSNDKANTVFKDRGGYIKGADISADWRDLEIILDGTKFQIPCDISDFFDAGFDLNTRDVSTSTLVKKSRTTTVSFINPKGTVIKLTLMNESDMADKPLDECSVVEVLVDVAEFVSIKERVDIEKSEAAENYKKRKRELVNKYGSAIPDEYMIELEELERLANGETDETVNVEVENTDTADETISDESDTDDLSIDSSENTVEDVEETDTTQDEEVETEETVEETEDTEETEDEESEEKVLPLGTTQDEIDNYDHELILAGGVTWGVYLDDLIAYYGKNCSKTNSANNTCNCTYTSENKSMTINIGKLKGINRVKLSCIQE